nr:MAG: replication associated protein [Cressdnaviricota sp.]
MTLRPVLPKRQQAKAKRWCFTQNNPKHGKIPFEKEEVKYEVQGLEVGESGTPHYQGFVIFKSAVRLRQLKNEYGEETHWEIARGTNKQAADYCKKEGKYEEQGELPEENHIKGGEATKRMYSEAFQSAKEGKCDDIEDMLRVKHYRTFKEVQKDYMGHLPSLDDTCGIWYYGESGAGKSLTARSHDGDAYLKQCNKWWDGYQGEETVIIDDFDKSHACLAHYLKIWADHYEFMGETKGGQIKIRPKLVIITSQYQIHEIWEDPETQDALSRRFSEIKINK